MAKGESRGLSCRSYWFILVLVGLTLSACVAPQSRWRADAVSALHFARQDNADKILPSEFKSVHIAFSQAELLLQQGKDEEADQFYQLAIIKGDLLRKNVLAKNKLLLHEAGEANRAAIELARKRRPAGQGKGSCCRKR